MYMADLTSLDERGLFDGDDRKYIVTQSRMLWGFSALVDFATARYTATAWPTARRL